MIVLALLVVGYELVRWLGKGQGAINRPRATLPKAASQKSRPPAPIAVLTSDGQETPVQDFYQAMEMAVGAQGSVVLNQEPLRISTGDRAFSLLASGWLKVTAGKGASPVLLVELKGQQPFLTTGSGLSLALDGLTIRVRYKDQTPVRQQPRPHHPGRRSGAAQVLCFRGGPGNRSARLAGSRLRWRHLDRGELLV